MGRELGFWKHNGNPNKKNSDIYKELIKEQYVDFVSEIPVREIICEFRLQFGDWDYVDDFFFEKEEKSFQLLITKQIVRVDCYRMTEHDMNKIIDIMLKFGCPLYDASIDVRFDGNW